MKVLDQLGAAASASDETVRNHALEEGRKLLKERNNNIQLAEKYGWEAVDCYVQEPLACDSDDKKRIKRAVKESKVLKAENRKPSKPLRTITWLFSATLHCEPKFPRHEVGCSSLVETEIQVEPKRRVFSLRTSRSFCKELPCTYPPSHNGKNILREVPNRVQIGTMIVTHSTCPSRA